METRTYRLGAELDPLIYQHRDEDGDIIDFSTGWTFTLGCAPVGGAALATGGFPKTTGITGTSTGIQVDWSTSTELAGLTGGNYDVQLRARRTSDSRDLDLAPVRLILKASLV